MPDEDKKNLTDLTVTLLSAYVSNNSVRSDDLAGLIQSTHAALSGIETAAATPPEVEAPVFTPAVTVRKSLASREHILSLIDGKPYKTLKRHLAGHGLTPEQYRERYSLAKSYPMVAPAYSEHRRAVAQMLGLGRKPGLGKGAAAVPAVAAVAPPTKTPTKVKAAKAATPKPTVPAVAAAVQPVPAKAPKAAPKAASKAKANSANATPAATISAEPKAARPPRTNAAKPAGTRVAKARSAVTAVVRPTETTAIAITKAAPVKASAAKPSAPAVKEKRAKLSATFGKPAAAKPKAKPAKAATPPMTPTGDA